MAETVYTPRLDLPYAIERGRAQVITLSVYSGATLTAPASGVLTLYAPDGSTASTGAVAIVSDVAEYTVSGLTSYAYGEGWAVEWALTMPDGVVHTYRSDAALCRVAPQQTVCPADLYRLQPYLDSSSAGAISSETWVDQCREAYVELQRRLWGWTVSTYLGELWPTANMLGTTPHKRFSVSAPSTSMVGRRETELARNRPGGSAVVTRLLVRWMYRIRADAQVTDYDAALTDERTLATAAVSDPTGTDVRWILTTLSRTLQSDGEASFVAGTIAIDAFHQLNLE
jgi:hypothetical protein